MDPVRKLAARGSRALAICLGAMLLVSGCSNAGGEKGEKKETKEDEAKEAAAISPAAANLHVAMRTLWQDHVLWTRMVIVSTAAKLPDLEPTTQRLLQNQADIGNAVKPYYGEEAGNKLTALLREHIMGAAEVLAAAKGKDATRLDTAKKAWFANADTIAAFLSTANPGNWPLADMQSMMRDHLNLTLTEAVDQLQGHYPQSVADYDRVQEEILKMADMLSDGIVKQFPDKV